MSKNTKLQIEKNAQTGLIVRSSVRAGTNGKPTSANHP